MTPNEVSELAARFELPWDTERFVQAFECQNYIVGDQGTVISRPRPRSPGGIMRQSPLPAGYLRVSISEGGRARMAFVHRLVLLSFVGRGADGTEASHINGEKQDNRLVNLRWETSADNERRKVEHGTVLQGEKANAAKLTAEQVADIRRSWKIIKQRDLAAKYGVHVTTIRDVQKGRAWLHLPSAAQDKDANEAR